ncbi:hypothetical protein DYB37_008536 [Aphanomyces astaci]|uniref:Uncharacterized protein n=1 Tax=Aphanomyces astaci TaxID=112090 RepID=A0A3R7AK23_APHAT|nr:hypothetical protein DYB35_002662 [Aphanomyces astaci]RHZ16254.1 hypothetical protein DYB37_008536 [Aphanomyces astaci]
MKRTKAKRICLACITDATATHLQGRVPASTLNPTAALLLTFPRACPPPSHVDLTALAPRFQHDATFFLLLEQAILAIDGAARGLIQLIGVRDVAVVASYNLDDPPMLSRIEAGLVTLQSSPSIVREAYHDHMSFVRVPLMLAAACIGTLEVECPNGYLLSMETLEELDEIASTAAMVMQNTAIESSAHPTPPGPSSGVNYRHKPRGNSTSTASTSSTSVYSYHTMANNDDSNSSASDSAEERMMEALLTMSKHTAHLIRGTNEECRYLLK